MLVQTTFTELIDKVPPRKRLRSQTPAHRVLIVVDTIERANQAAAAVRRRWPHLVGQIRVRGSGGFANEVSDS